MSRRTAHRALVLLPALALVASAAACAEEVPKSNPSQAGGQVTLIKPGFLTTCTHLPYAPFQSKQGDKVVGFDVELVDKIAASLGVKQDIVDTAFEGIESGQSFNTGQCDIAAAAMTITDVRKGVMDFSDPYFDANQALLVKKGSGIDSLEKLRGKTLGVQQGTTGEKYAEENKGKFGYNVRQFEDLGLLQTAVKTGQIDAGINDNGVHADFAKANPDTEMTAEFPTGEKYGLGMKKGNGALLAKVNEVIAKYKTDGSYESMYEKWLGKKPATKP